ncbi:MAG: hypothetical protein KAI74_04055 [Kiritimatiellae bacterium]|nr:hypothetical protein [Kiritimatiellia bacterium]
MTEIQQQANAAVKSLNKSVNETLDRKKRLGQYAVVWQGGKVVHLFEKQKPTK